MSAVRPVFYTETLALRFGAAARHGARLLVSAAVFGAVFGPRCPIRCTCSNITRSTGTMFATDTACYDKRGAAFLRAHFSAATAVLAAPASCSNGTGALVERAEPKCAMFAAKSSSYSIDAAAFSRARHCLAVVFRALPSHRDGVVDARVRCAVSIGAVLDADKLAEDLRGVAVWIGAGQLHRVLAA